MKTSKKVLAILLTIATLIGIFSCATPVLATEVTEITEAESDANEVFEATEAEENAEQSTSDEPEILNEVVEWRTETAKYFRNSDGSYTAAQYAYPVHYKENGEWKEIDNTLTQKSVLGTDKKFVAENTNTPASFPEELNQDSDNEISISAENYTIRFSPDNNQKGFKSSDGKIKDREDLESVKIVEKVNESKEEKASTFKLTDTKQKTDIKETPKNEKFKVENKNSTIVYEDVFKNVDLEYELNNSKLKESIVLNEKQESYVFSFNMDLGGLYPVACQNGSINLCSDNEGENPVAEIEAPYMVDSNGEYSDAVTMTIKADGEKYILTVTADESWLNDKVRAYPVVIDPTINLNINRLNVIDNYIDDSEASDSHPYAYHLYAGHSSLGKTRAYVKFNLPDLPDDNCIITNAFIVYHQNSVDKGSTDGYLTIHKVTENWNNTDSSLLPTWNNKPSFDDKVLDYAKIELNEGNVARAYQFDITRTVKEWYEGGTNYGLMLKSKNESVVNRVQLYSAENSAEGAYPAIYVNFRNNKGIEGYWDYSTYGIGVAGTAYVNDYTGNLVYELPIASSISEIMPVSIVGYYNNYCANELISETEAEDVRSSIGRGFRLFYQQTVLPSSEYGLTGDNAKLYPYVYTDGDGTEHYIQKVVENEGKSNEKTTYKDEDGLGLTFTTDCDETATYQITDKAHNNYYFNSKGNLGIIKDQNGNKITIKYKEANEADGLENKSRIDKIIDGAGHTYKFTYYEKSSTGVELDYVEKITDDAGRTVSFDISDGMLNHVYYYTGDRVDIVYENATEGIINYVQSNKSYRLNFNYTSKATGRRVKTVTEYGVASNGETITDTTKGQVITFDRSKYNTTVMRSCGMDGTHGNDDDIITTVQYDNMGRAISQQMKYGSGDEIGAGSVAYTTNDSDETASGFKNKVSGSGATGKYVENLLFGGNAESTTGWNPSKIGSISYEYGTSSASKYIGKKSIKLTATDVKAENARCYFRQNYTDNIKSNTEYTLSAYVKTGDLTPCYDSNMTGAFIQIVGYDSSGNAISSVNKTSEKLTQRTDLSVNEGWRRLSCTVKTNNNVAELRCYLILWNTEGSVCFDGIQLEKGGTVNDYNMLENSHFTILSSGCEPESWAGTSQFEFSTGSTVTNGVKRTQTATGSYTNAVIITGSADVEKGVTQTVAVEGNPDDTYILSGWAKGYPLNSTFHLNNKDEEIATFEIAVKVNYSATDGTNPSQFKTPASFNTTITDWQCASVPISLKYTGGEDGVTYTPTSIKIIPRYHNQENYVYFDKIMLVKDAASSYTYDKEGNLVSASSNSEQKESMKYDDKNNLTSYTDTAGYKTTLTYEDNNNLNYTKSAKGVYTNYDYDAYGNVTSTDARNKGKIAEATSVIKTTAEYSTKKTAGSVTINAGAYKTKVFDQNGNATTYNIDTKTGALTSVTDAKDVTTTYEYYPTTNEKAFGKQKSVSIENSKVTYEYNGKEQLEKIIFGSSPKEEYSFVYDSFGNVTKTKVGSQELSTNTFASNNGVLEKTTYGNGDIRRFTYNDLGQQTEVYGTDAHSASTAERLLYSWTYNDSGVALSHTDHVNGFKYIGDYDSIGRLSKELVQNSSDSSFVGFSEYGYDIRNNLTKLITNYGGKANKQQYFYSAVDESSKSGDYAKDNLPTMYKLNDECYALYAYASLNRYNERKLVLGANTNLYYNYVYRLSDRNASGESKYRTTQVEEEYIGNDVYIYGYDVLGNITSIKTATRSGTANETSHSEAQDYVTYSYDKLGQLKRENLVGKNTTVWDYDDLGNITAKNEYAYTTDVDLAGKTATKTVTYYYKEDDIPYEIEPETTKTYSSWNNLLLAVNLDGSEKVSNDELIEYDEIGNPKKYLGASLSWNGRQLTSYSTDDKTITYTYDSNGLRASKTVNGVTSKYFYVNGQLHYEERSDGTKLYFFYDSTGALTSIEYNNTNYYPATNLKGDVVAIYNSSGVCVARYEYDAWGNIIDVVDNSGVNIAGINPIRYRGYYYDTETELYYLQSRYYNAEVGRFLNADGYLTTGQGVLSYNMFAYCQNNPVMFSDPSGTLCGLCMCTGVNPCPSCMPALPKFSNIDFLFGNVTIPTQPYIAPKSSTNNIADSISTAYDTMDTISGLQSGFYMTNNHYLINSAPSISENFGKAVSIGLIGYETVTGVCNNYLSGASNKKIVWDAAVDVTVLGSTTWCCASTGAAICAKYGTMISPGMGTVYGAVGGAIAGALFSLFSDDAIEYLKGLVK